MREALRDGDVERLDHLDLGALHQRLDRRAVGHVAAQDVVAGDQVAAPERDRGVELEEAGVGDHALGLEQLADRARVGALRDLDRDRAGLLVLALEGLERRVDGPERRADEDERQQGDDAAEGAAEARLGGRGRQRPGAPGGRRAGRGRRGSSAAGRPPRCADGPRAAARRARCSCGSCPFARERVVLGGRLVARAALAPRGALLGGPLPLLWCPSAQLIPLARAPRLATGGGT